MDKEELEFRKMVELADMVTNTEQDISYRIVCANPADNDIVADEILDNPERVSISWDELRDYEIYTHTKTWPLPEHKGCGVNCCQNKQDDARVE